MSTVREQAVAAKKAAQKLASLDRAVKDKALLAVAARLRENKERVFAANRPDLEAGEKAGLSKAMLDRLRVEHLVVRLEQPADGRLVDFHFRAADPQRAVAGHAAAVLAAIHCLDAADPGRRHGV